MLLLVRNQEEDIIANSISQEAAVLLARNDRRMVSGGRSRTRKYWINNPNV